MNQTTEAKDKTNNVPMSNKTFLFGASDDLIEIEGAITDEVGHYSEQPMKFEASDGTKGNIVYDGDWLINVAPIGPKCILWQPPVGEDNKHTGEIGRVGVPGYSACLVFEDIEWIKIGRKKFKPN